MSGKHLAVRLEAARKGDHTHRIFRRNLETPGNSRSGSFQNRVLRECHKNGPEIHIPLGNKQVSTHKTRFKSVLQRLLRQVRKKESKKGTARQIGACRAA